MDIVYKFLIPLDIAELMAASTGLFFLFKKRLDLPTKLFVASLCLIVLVEGYGLITCFGYYSDYRWFGFLKDTFFARNSWLYDHSNLIFDSYIALFFTFYMSNKKLKYAIRILVITLFIGSELWQFDVIFSNRSDSPLQAVYGSVLVVISAMFIFLEVIKSDMILRVSKFFPFYLAVGIVVFKLCTTPIQIYFTYHNLKNEFFINFRLWVFLIVNLFLYSLITIGFIVCYRKKSLR